jgi:predicted phosphodiesterase
VAVYGLLSDVHGNAHALEAVVALLQARRVDSFVCLGDIVGYGAEPRRCIDILRDLRASAVTGNHDLIGIGRLGFGRCAIRVEYALRRTRRELDGPRRSYLASLGTSLTLEGRLLVFHASLPDVERYVTTARQAAQSADEVRQAHPGVRLCLFGHTHEPKLYELFGGEMRERPAAESVDLDPALFYLANPGSVDGARKERPGLAECAVLDSDRWRIEFHRVPYDHEASEARARAEGPTARRVYELRRRLRDGLRRRWRASGLGGARRAPQPGPDDDL